MSYIIDGYFLTEKTNGVQRFGYEILKRWDKYDVSEPLRILVPEYYDDSKEFEKLQVIKYGSTKGKLWEQIDFVRYAKKNRLDGIFFTNIIPVCYRKGIVVLHDIIFKVRPDFFNSTFRGKISVLWRRYLYRLIVLSRMKIVTVSNFSKKEILNNYRLDESRIEVIYNSWQHMDEVGEDEDILNNNNIKRFEYFFSLATIAKNKNFEWILNCANNNPSYQFVVAGGGDLDSVRIKLGFDKLDNVLFLGYVSDEEAKSLMKNCTAFLFPTLYEGFGIPPLEAVACGAKSIIVSDTPCMHEIYKDYAFYINPLDYNNTRIDEFKTINTKDVLKLYDWNESAYRFYKLL